MAKVSYLKRKLLEDKLSACSVVKDFTLVFLQSAKTNNLHINSKAYRNISYHNYRIITQKSLTFKNIFFIVILL